MPTKMPLSAINMVVEPITGAYFIGGSPPNTPNVRKSNPPTIKPAITPYFRMVRNSIRSALMGEAAIDGDRAATGNRPRG